MDRRSLEPDLVSIFDSRRLLFLSLKLNEKTAHRYDLWWPPVWGGSYWTASLQYRALRGGARLGRAIGRGHDVVDEYDSQASMILDYMQASPD